NFKPGAVDHFSLSIKKLDMPALHAFLTQNGASYQDYPSGRDTGIVDADGIRTQLSPEDGWSFLNPTNFPPEATTIQDEPVFRPTALEHVLLNVADPEKSIAFYRQFLGRPSSEPDGRVWFQTGTSRVGLARTPAGQRPGVDHFRVAAGAFDYDNIARKLQQIGAKLEKSEAPNLASFRDPDGLLVQALGR